MSRIRILPYRRGSKSSKALAEAIGGKRLRLEGSRFRPRLSDIIINWGNTSPYKETYRQAGRFFNLPESIKTASNKRSFFNQVEREGRENLIPRFWTWKGDIPDDAFPVVCRTILAGHSGQGIVISETREDLVDAPLYTQYIKKKNEYRIHVGKNVAGEYTVLAEQRKARREDVENPDWRIRNHANGFIFQRHNFETPELVRDAAIKVFSTLNLDFGALDVVYNEAQGRAYVLECNTAPGIEGSTLSDYVQFFRGFL